MYRWHFKPWDQRRSPNDMNMIRYLKIQLSPTFGDTGDEDKSAKDTRKYGPMQGEKRARSVAGNEKKSHGSNWIHTWLWVLAEEDVHLITKENKGQESLWTVTSHCYDTSPLESRDRFGRWVTGLVCKWTLVRKVSESRDLMVSTSRKRALWSLWLETG